MALPTSIKVTTTPYECDSVRRGVRLFTIFYSFVRNLDMYTNCPVYSLPGAKYYKIDTILVASKTTQATMLKPYLGTFNSNEERLPLPVQYIDPVYYSAVESMNSVAWSNINYFFERKAEMEYQNWLSIMTNNYTSLDIMYVYAFGECWE